MSFPVPIGVKNKNRATKMGSVILTIAGES
jgi:hypothetical protein